MRTPEGRARARLGTRPTHLRARGRAAGLTRHARRRAFRWGRSPQPGSARGHPSQEEPSAGEREGAPLARRAFSRGARGGTPRKKSPQPGSARGHPSQEEPSAGEREGAPLARRALSRGARGGTPRKKSPQGGARGGTPRKKKPSAGEREGAPLGAETAAELARRLVGVADPDALALVGVARKPSAGEREHPFSRGARGWPTGACPSQEDSATPTRAPALAPAQVVPARCWASHAGQPAVARSPTPC